MSAEPAARVLDITRLVSRLGRPALTGIDRVELAYLRALSAGTVPLFLLLRTPYGYLLLPRAAGAALEGWVADAATLPRPGLVDRLRGRSGPQARAEAGLRRLALARAPHRGLARMLRRALPRGGAYLNVGQTALAARPLAAVKRAGLTVAVMIHDTIPLDHPEFSAPQEPERFRERLAAVAAHADLAICNSGTTREAVARHMATLPRRPRLMAAPLGVETPRPDPRLIPPGLDLAHPCFVALGTIEPRRNHALLLDLWDILHRERGEAAPRLLLLGHRGWRNEAVFARLDARPPGVLELPGLPDGAVAAILAGARALLVPSLAEGFGLPAAEAAALGVPVVCHDLPVWREVLGDYPVYAGVNDLYSWQSRLQELEAAPGKARTGPVLFSWPDHFRPVLQET